MGMMESGAADYIFRPRFLRGSYDLLFSHRVHRGHGRKSGSASAAVPLPCPLCLCERLLSKYAATRKPACARRDSRRSFAPLALFLREDAADLGEDKGGRGGDAELHQRLLGAAAEGVRMAAQEPAVVPGGEGDGRRAKLHAEAAATAGRLPARDHVAREQGEQVLHLA